MLSEWLVLGQAAYGEEMVGGQITDGWQVKVDGRLIWADRFRVTDDVFPRLRSRALLADSRAIGTLIYFGPDAEARVDFLRDLAPQQVSLRHDSSIWARDRAPRRAGAAELKEQVCRRF